MSSEGHSLLMPFDTDEPEFTRGFEAGRLYALCDSEMTTWEFSDGETEPFDEVCPLTIHAANAEMALRIAERYGLTVRSEEIGDEWLNVWFVRKPEEATDG